MLNFREAIIDDSKQFFDWANDSAVREQSFNSSAIEWENHNDWFISKIKDTTCLMLIFQNDDYNNIGQVRIQKEDDKVALIGVSVSSEHRGKGYANEMLKLASDFFLKNNPEFYINAYIKNNNFSSKCAFEKAEFEFIEMVVYKGFKSFHYIKRLNENR
jgi:RimJ/RimL family protein N-acetyltransferase